MYTFPTFKESSLGELVAKKRALLNGTQKLKIYHVQSLLYFLPTEALHYTEHPHNTYSKSHRDEPPMKQSVLLRFSD